MSADEPKAALGLADQFENFLKYGKDDEFISWIDEEGVTILAALRAVEAARAFPTSLPYGNDCCGNAGPLHGQECRRYKAGYRDGVEAVQALLTDVAVTQAGDSATIAAHEEPSAYLSIAPPDVGHKAGPSQALLEGEK